MAHLGIKLKTIVCENNISREVYIYEHPWLIRLTHWLSAIALFILFASGLEIFSAFPSFGDKVPQDNFFEPSSVLRLGGWLGGALQWHYSAAWIFLSSYLV
ncbi:MAG: cytochrome b/b6 domain-containing protein, partial [Acidobacteriota bacterium]